MKISKPFVMMGLAAWIQTATATTPQHVVLDTYSDFAAGENISTSLSDTGILTPAPEMRRLGDLDAGQIWCVLPERDGKILAGTSPDGKLLRIDDSGKSVLVTKFAESHIYALARNPAGDVFVATSPKGKIFKLDPKGKPVVYFDPGEEYIWALLFDKSGVLYAATGTRGRIYRITGEEKGEIYYDSDETHIRSLALDKEGRLLAGSADSGYLYRISKKDEGVVLSASGRQEVNRIAVAPDGSIYFSAIGSSKGGASAASKSGAIGGGISGLRALLAVSGGESESSGSGKSNGSTGSSSNGAKGKSSGTASQLFRIDGSLFATEIWHTSETILTLDFRDGKVFAGTGNDGYLYSITPRGEATRLLKVEGESISAAALPGEERFVLATSNPARIFLAGGSRHTVGVYDSDAIDSSSFARWGSVNLQARGKVEIVTRSGNTPKPDKSWYAWTPIKDAQIQSAPARYLQIELKLEDASVDRMDVVYLPKNSAPHIDRVEVLTPGVGYLAIVPPPVPAQPRTADQLLASAGKSETESIFSLPVRFQPTAERGLRTVVWKATDSNNDELTYTIYQRREGNPAWHLLAKEYKETVLSWDSGGWADGSYYIKVVATDAKDNAPGEALTDEAISRVITVDNSPPEITRLATTDGKVRFRVTDGASLLVSVEISTNGKDFRPVPPVDGILDSRSEEFEAPLAPGEVLFIRAEDEFGNVKGDIIESTAAAPLKK